MFCPKCGNDVSEDAKFCANCGLDLRGVSRRPIGSVAGAPNAHLTFCVIQGGRLLQEIDIAELGKTSVTFGTAQDNDIVIHDASKIMSRHHGALVLDEERCTIVDLGSTNGLYANGSRQEQMTVGPGDALTVGKQKAGRDSIVLLLGRSDMRWRSFDLSKQGLVSIGRSPENDIVLPFPTVSARHALLKRDGGGNWFIEDAGSFNGTYADGRAVSRPTALFAGSKVVVGTVGLVYSNNSLFYTVERMGVDVVAYNLVKRRKVHGQERTTNDHISLHVKRGEFVAIVGGSGCGKSTLLNALVGNELADEGTVTVDGIDLYANYDRMKNTIGYVPQKDIVYDNLTLTDMLHYGADLRMPPDSTKKEKEARIEEIIQMLELNEVRSNLISHMSGGQKKRASIAVELLADPHLLYLDEPTSGLDPGIEKSLMQKLADLAKGGRTIILVTHTTLNLHLCDQVVFLGAGGRLCFMGSPSRALDFFHVDDFVDIYPKIDKESLQWAGRFEAQRKEPVAIPESTGKREARKSPSFISQLGTLSARYVRLLVNDRARLALLLLQAPLLAALICVVAGKGCFTEYEATKSCLFALSCAAFWVGILDAIQEICKERDIFCREYAGGMKLAAYVLSKVLVLGVLCLVQSLLLTAVFLLFKAPPQTALVNASFELFFSIFLISFSAMCLGLLVSALFDNPDRAIAMAPLLIMPQILFSGLVFKLEGAAETVSFFVNCRWGMEAMGTTANLNALNLRLYGEEVTIPEQQVTVDEVTTDVPSFDTQINGMDVTVPEQPDMTLNDVQVTVPQDTMTIDSGMYPHDAESMFEYTLPHLLQSWEVLLLFCVVCVVACCVVLRVKSRN